MGYKRAKIMMKKIMFFLLSACMFLGFVSCEKNEVTEGNLVGKWQMQTIEAEGQSYPGGDQIWEFTEDHKLYISAEGEESMEAGTWSLDGKKLTLDFIPVPVTVSKLTSSTLVLEGPGFTYTYKKLK